MRPPSLRKLRRWTFAMIAIASLILCLTTVGLWVRSYWTADRYIRVDGARDLNIISTRGSLRSYYNLHDPFAEQIREHRGWKAFRFDPKFDPYDGKDDFAYEEHTPLNKPSIPAYTQFVVRFPHWSLALLFAIVPAWWGVAIVRARRRPREGRCAKCGYDLRVQLALSQTLSDVEGSEQTESNGRASPGRCPECGTTAAPANA